MRWATALSARYNARRDQALGAGRERAQSQVHRRRDPAASDHGRVRRVGIRQVVAGVRHDLPRGAAPLPGDVLVVRQAVPRAHGAAGGALDRRPVARRSPSTSGRRRATLDRRSGRWRACTTTCVCSTPAWARRRRASASSGACSRSTRRTARARPARASASRTGSTRSCSWPIPAGPSARARSSSRRRLATSSTRRSPSTCSTRCAARTVSTSTRRGRSLTDEQRNVVLNGSDRIRIPYGKHPLASRLRWSGITARPQRGGRLQGHPSGDGADPRPEPKPQHPPVRAQPARARRAAARGSGPRRSPSCSAGGTSASCRALADRGVRRLLRDARVRIGRGARRRAHPRGDARRASSC